MNAPQDLATTDSQPVVTADPALAATLESWRQRLVGVGVPCKAVALDSANASLQYAFPLNETELCKAWEAIQTRLSPQNPIALTKCGNDMLMAVVMHASEQGASILGICLAQPVDEKIIQIVQLSLGWLQLSLAEKNAQDSARAAYLLEMLGHVLSQERARAGAQEWINRTAAWVRAELGESRAGLTLALTLFAVRKNTLSWFVSSDTAWAERASQSMQEANEVAARALFEIQEYAQPGWWALPLLESGVPAAILVVRCDEVLPEHARVVLRACANVGEPILRRWKKAEQSLWLHALDACRDVWRKLRGPGFWVWKCSAAVALIALAGLTLWPVDDRVSANLVIEGRVRQIVSVPFDGFVAQVFVRPGDSVKRGQLLAWLDERDLLLERDKQASARDQALGKLRQAMGEREAVSIQQASAELKQAEAELALIDAKLSRTKLIAPLEGIVVTGDWAQQIGGPVETGKEMFELAAVEGYRVVLHVADSDIAHVKAGQSGSLRLTGHPDRAYRFRVATVTATASVQDGHNGFRVEAEWIGKDNTPSLSPGMQGVGKITTGTTNLLTLWTRPLIDWLRLKLWSMWW